MAPIYQPEVAARAVLWASGSRRRVTWVGTSTVVTALGGKLAPQRLVDRFLGLTNYSAQQTDEPEDAGRPDYLLSPVPGDHGAHGPFDDRSHARSPLLALNMHRRLLALAAAVVVAGRALRPTIGSRT